MKVNRDPYIDNARFILVVLVVIGHLISPFKDNNEIIYFINNFLASFRMPALIYLTGFFSKKFYKEGFIEKITIKLLFPYLIFQLIYNFNPTLSINWFNPSFGLWFLLSVYSWNLLLFIFTRLKKPIIFALIIGVGIGLVENAGHYFSISRTFVFFPIFLIGFYTEKVHLEWFKKKQAKLLSVIALIVSFTILSYFSVLETRGLMLGKTSYSNLDFSNLEGIYLRALFYVIMLLGVVFYLPWVPKKQNCLTNFGQVTAYIYILHLPIIGFLYNIGWFYAYESWKVITSPALALFISILLCSKPVILIMKPFVTGEAVSKLIISIKMLKRYVLRKTGGVYFGS
ncbi:hypothetical protein CIB95_03485 [Lottiidibacillus patelloidae]|uniref:Acyltransferase 3 domain-containing protein n=1 Tax=Lottiidibacillus patelloidae TaxID=2670334 RepID=A0A263BY30_9BACI|nr:acyltransferase family protein [Lottiidibacillus patelloidae]OZM58643.1 hypothetical protein CIB95_03485 [Lottiidibacillus patelloidae]